MCVSMSSITVIYRNPWRLMWCSEVMEFQELSIDTFIDPVRRLFDGLCFLALKLQ